MDFLDLLVDEGEDARKRQSCSGEHPRLVAAYLLKELVGRHEHRIVLQLINPKRRIANGATLSVVLGCEHRDLTLSKEFRKLFARDVSSVNVMNEQHASKWKSISLASPRKCHCERLGRSGLAAAWT